MIIAALSLRAHGFPECRASALEPTSRVVSRRLAFFASSRVASLRLGSSRPSSRSSRLVSDRRLAPSRVVSRRPGSSRIVVSARRLASAARAPLAPCCAPLAPWHHTRLA